MLVLKLMNENENWRDILSADPYNIIIKEDGEYVLLKYSQLNSDFANPIVRECRGSIFRQENGKWICVCRAFDKFGNYGEDYVPTIEWESARVLEKIDGSLMKLWYDKGMWRLSTNGTIDAFDAPLNDFNITFGDYFIECLSCDFESFTMTLDQNYCYMFEMVGPKNRVVIEYDSPKLYGLGQRNMKTMEEEEYSAHWGKWSNVWLPQRFTLHNFDEVIKVAEALTRDEEGFVVNDRFFHRVKIKSPEYLMAARLRNNGVITRSRLVEIFLEDKVDDFIAYCPQYRKELDEVLEEIRRLYLDISGDCDHITYNYDNKKLERKVFAEMVKKNMYSDFLFSWYNGETPTALHYIKKQRVNQLIRMLDKVRERY